MRDVAYPVCHAQGFIEGGLVMHMPRVFVHVPGSEMKPKSRKKNGGPVKAERVHMSPAEQANRIRRAARALQQGVMQQDLIARGFKPPEIKQAQAMIGKK